MVDVSELVRFTPGEKTLRMAMDIAAAAERYRIVMEGPAGVRLRKLNHIRTIRGNPKITFAEMSSATGISRSAIQKHIERLKGVQRLRRVGPDKGGHWAVIEKA